MKSRLVEISNNRKCSLTVKYGVVVEGFVESFGWPDFVVVLSGTNIELIKASVLMLREMCGGAHTSTYIGASEDEIVHKVEELKDGARTFGESDAGIGGRTYQNQRWTT